MLFPERHRERLPAAEKRSLFIYDILYHGLYADSPFRPAAVAGDDSESVLDVLQGFADLCLDLVAELHIVGKKLFDGFPALGELAVIVAEP